MKNKTIAIREEIHDELLNYSSKTRFNKMNIAETAIMEFLEKRGLKKKWSIDKLPFLKLGA